MDEDTFWKCTLLKLDELMTVHNQVQKGEEREPERLTIEELLGWG